MPKSFGGLLKKTSFYLANGVQPIFRYMNELSFIVFWTKWILLYRILNEMNFIVKFGCGAGGACKFFNEMNCVLPCLPKLEEGEMGRSIFK